MRTIIGCLIFTYVVFRAYNVGITYDEVTTLHDYLQQTFVQSWGYTTSTANNHLINSSLIHFLYLLGFKGLFIARLPNVLAFILYFYAASRLSRELFKPTKAILFFICLVINPFILDFFSLSRGYGLALAFELTSVYYYIKYIRNATLKNAVKSILLAALSFFSVFSFLPFLMAIAALLLFYKPSSQQSTATNGKRFRNQLVVCSLLLIVVLIAYRPLRILTLNQFLTYGGHTSFYHDTIQSLANSMLYCQYDNFSSKALAFVGTIVCASSLVIGNYSTKSDIILSKYLLFIPLISVILLNKLFGIPYVIDRTALFFFPIIVLITFQVSTNNFIAWVSSFLFVAVFATQGNLYRTLLWGYDSHTQELLTYLNREHARFYYDWPIKKSINYYIDQQRFPNLSIDSANYNYYITCNNFTLPAVKGDTIRYFAHEGVTLIRTRNSHK